jgi:TRAP-type mannitol/chloroaromatic compound transport system substrate-binding protein
MSKNNNFSPAIILLLVAAVTALSWLHVIDGVTDVAHTEQSKEQNTQDVFHWKLVTSWPKHFPGLGTAPEIFAEKLNAMSNGRLLVTVYGGGELVPALGVFDAVSQGTAELGHTAAYYWKGKIPAAPFFTSVPFGMNAQEMNGWLHYGGGMELWRETYAPFNVIPLAGGNTGVQMAGWFNKEINTVEDLKGLKMRIPGVGGEVFKRAGGVAVTIPGGELYTALQTGVIDATEWVGPYNDMAMGLHEVARYYYYPGWHEPGPSLEVLVNKEAFDSLPKDLQEMIEVAARYANQDMLDEYTARNNAALLELQTNHKVELRRLPDEVIRQLHSASEIYIADVVASDPMAKKVYKSWKAFADGAKNFHRITEQAYINARDIGEDN